ncbi:MAG: hypothetical protein ACI85J_000786 [Candidatus Poriferisodalaceae bacterium]|jgi:hypothetical protein
MMPVLSAASRDLAFVSLGNFSPFGHVERIKCFRNEIL